MALHGSTDGGSKTFTRWLFEMAGKCVEFVLVNVLVSCNDKHEERPAGNIRGRSSYFRELCSDHKARGCL